MILVVTGNMNKRTILAGKIAGKVNKRTILAGKIAGNMNKRTILAGKLAGNTLGYNAQYSPWLNPVESFFRFLKAVRLSMLQALARRTSLSQSVAKQSFRNPLGHAVPLCREAIL